jgi:integrase
MRAFLALAGTTTMRKGEILSLRWEGVHLEDAPYATLVRTKTSHQRHVPAPQAIAKTLKALPSFRTHEYLFPSRPTARSQSDPIAGTSASSSAHSRRQPASKMSAFMTCGM